MKEFADLVIEEGAPFNYKWYVRQLRHVSYVLWRVLCVRAVRGVLLYGAYW
jgi:imidazolonepropionase-like amidohydrolase